jgi:hypothetical protein
MAGGIDDAVNPSHTQRVTAADLAGGCIRIPIGGKASFPSSPQRLPIVLRGTRTVVQYNPRLGPDRERSGVLSIGSVLRDLVVADEILEVGQEGDRVVLT